MESNCKATTNVPHDQRCAYLCFPWSHLSSPSEDTPCDMVGFAVTTSTTIAEIRTDLVSPKVLSHHLSTEAISLRTMAVTWSSSGWISDSNFHMIDLTLLAPN